MITRTLSEQALKTINSYFHLPIPGHDVSCPYYNNRYSNVRAGLRVMIGKGNISDIADEATLLALREKVDLSKLSNDDLRIFLIENGIGVDCSGYVYHILDEEVRTRGKGRMKKNIKFPFVRTPWRKILTWLRPAEHAGVRTLAAKENSVRVPLAKILPGDMIVMINTGPKHDRNHVLLVTKVDFDETNLPTTVYYTHSFHWRTDGRYGHGVKDGKIAITDRDKSVLDQIWEENGKIGVENETLEHAKLAKELFITRFSALA